MQKITEVPMIDDGNWTGSVKLWKCEPPITYDKYGDGENMITTEYVVTSAVSNLWSTETYIFPTDENGNVSDWGEMPGSFQGEMDHDEAIRGLLDYANATVS